MTELAMPVSAQPEIRPAQIGSQPSTQKSCPLVPGVECFRPCHQKIAAPIHIAKTYSGGSTTPRPMETALSGKRPLVTMRVISIAAAHTAATIIAATAEVGSDFSPWAMSSATPRHCTAAGMANWSDTIEAAERVPSAAGGRNSR